jgi:hypothetical protein
MSRQEREELVHFRICKSFKPVYFGQDNIGIRRKLIREQNEKVVLIMDSICSRGKYSFAKVFDYGGSDEWYKALVLANDAALRERVLLYRNLDGLMIGSGDSFFDFGRFKIYGRTDDGKIKFNDPFEED